MSQTQTQIQTQNPQTHTHTQLGETRMHNVYLVNTFSLNMLKELDNVVITLYVKELSVEEFCKELRGNVISAIGHASTAAIINTLCGTNLIANRVEVKVNDGDELIIFQLTIRPPEGKVYSIEELKQLLERKQITFIKVRINISKPKSI
ncbi:MAG: DUF1874 domain-containing protein [Desulfurococcaceae archaeon]